MGFNFSNINSKYVANVTLQHVTSGTEYRAFFMHSLTFGEKTCTSFWIKPPH